MARTRLRPTERIRLTRITGRHARRFVPPLWGDPNVVRQRLGDAVTDVFFDRGVMTFPALSPQHYRKSIEEALGPVVKLVASLQSEPQKLADFCAQLEGFIERHFDGNTVRQQFLMTRATKR
jgi:hypothetical protein